MKKLEISFDEKDLFIQLFGQHIYAVGGCVRERIRNQPLEAKEIDLLIARHSVEDIVKKLEPYGKVNLVGKSFGIIKFAINTNTYDISLPREDIPKEVEIRRHKDFIVTADPNIPIEKDLQRRDFRCNSIAVRLKDGCVIDPFSGWEDTQKKRIRLTNPEAFPEDPLRILRAARFASFLGFKIDRGIYQSAQGVDLSGLSVERINEELFKILLESPLPSVGLEQLFMLGALRQLFPELYDLTLCIQDSCFHPEKDAYGHHSVWQHTKITADQAQRLSQKHGLDRGEKLALMLAALYHDIGKPDTTHWEYKRNTMSITSNGHDTAGEEKTKKIFNRFKIFSWEAYNLRKTVLPLIRCHHRTSELWSNRSVVTKKAFNRLAADVNGEIELLIYLDAADRAGRSEKPLTKLDQKSLWLLNKFKELKVSKESIKPLIMGRDLIELNVKPGPHMGKILHRLYKLQLDNEFDTKNKGLQLAKRMVKKELQ